MVDIPGRRTQKHRRLGRNNKKKLWLSKPFLVLGALILGLMILYVALVVQVAMENPAAVGGEDDTQLIDEGRPSNERRNQVSKPDVIIKPDADRDSQHQKTQASNDGAKKANGGKGPRGSSKKSDIDGSSQKLPPIPKINKSLPERQVRRPKWMAKPKGFGVKPQVLAADSGDSDAAEGPGDDSESYPDPEHMLKAFVEQIDFDEWEQKPLPPRKNAKADKLYELQYPNLNSCKKLPEMIPADEYTDADTFLPWVHDVFPTHDGKFIQFVAQNRRRCHTGNTPEEIEILHLTQPNIALFQHVPVKRIKEGDETRYKLTSHEDADPDGVATRFICRFKPSMEETLSVYNFDYDYASYRKSNYGYTFKYDDGGIKSVHLTQFLFRCPVPEHLVDIVKSGESVKDDWATLFVDIIPIRTPPRYGRSNEFLQPRYAETRAREGDRFEPSVEWGDNYILPRIEDSGRWENFPICRPSLLEYYSEEERSKAVEVSNVDEKLGVNLEIGPKVHRLVSCMWASAGYTTRGERFAINDGQRRLLEWVHYNKLLGFDHFYLYDNSYAYSSDITLKPIADLFPGEITYIKWPFQVCNNNPNNVDSPGERSSQYAAEASCRLRFGPHVDWIGQFDMDEYLIPLGSYTSVLPILDKLDQSDTKVLSFGSWRAWPRRDLIE
jgi:Glycosyltransferase family 92